MSSKLSYVAEPENKSEFTQQFDGFYTKFARTYDLIVKILPFWKRWLNATLPHIHGPRVLEISFGTGYLLTQFAPKFETYGLDYNQKFVDMLQNKLIKAGIKADIMQGDVQSLPYVDEFFDSIVNTMAFTAYPDAILALSEMHRVLKPGGRIIMVDIDYPLNQNRAGIALTKAWIAGGDIVRDMAPLFEQFNFTYTDQEIGGFGSVHLYIAEKQ